LKSSSSCQNPSRSFALLPLNCTQISQRGRAATEEGFATKEHKDRKEMLTVEFLWLRLAALCSLAARST
jgi:hypothetical protein